MKNLLLLILLSFATFAYAQTGTLKGKVIDENGEIIMFATVAVKKDGSLVTGTQTDFDGDYRFDSLVIGTYDVSVSYVGYQTKTIADVVIFADKDLNLNVEISQGVEIGCSLIYYYYPTLFDLENTTQGAIFNSSEIQRSPIKN